MAMASLSTLSRPLAVSIPRFLLPSVGAPRYATTQSYQAQNSRKAKKPKKQNKEFKVQANQLKIQERYSLCDAIRCLRAFGVGHAPSVIKYEVAIRLRTVKNGATIKSRIRLPYGIANEYRIGVICKEGSSVATAALAAGAVAVGEDSIFAAVKAGGPWKFNKLLCHPDSATALARAKVARILGLKRMMPSVKHRSITSNIVGMMQEINGTAEYKEKWGVVRFVVGALEFTPQMVSENIKTIMQSLKRDVRKLDDITNKDILEVVLSSTNGPGFSLSGGFKSDDPAASPELLSTEL